jgi:hypothetical protein
MEYVIQDSNILDPNLAEKFDAVIFNEADLFKEKVYKFIVNFHVDLIIDLSGFELFDLPSSEKPYKRKKVDEKDKMYEVLSFQLKQLEKILAKNNIEFYSSTIQGDQIESTHIIKIELVEDETVPITTKKGKKFSRGKVSSIIPSIIYTQNLIAKLKSERLNKLYDEFLGVIRNKKIMSEIFEIDETKNDDLLFKAFVSQYGDLWLTTSAKEKELRDKLLNKAIEVIEKYEKNPIV